jgi:hypothetical protein
MMSSTGTNTSTTSFTLTDARRLASKVAADMDQCNQFYGYPSHEAILKYLDELTIKLSEKCIEAYEFGFETPDGKRVISWKYTVSPAGDLVGGRAGGLYSKADVSDAKHFNFLTPNRNWYAKTDLERSRIDSRHAVKRSLSSGPSDGNGYWAEERIYDSGGVAMTRREFTPWH